MLLQQLARIKSFTHYVITAYCIITLSSVLGECIPVGHSLSLYYTLLPLCIGGFERYFHLQTDKMTVDEAKRGSDKGDETKRGGDKVCHVVMQIHYTLIFM